MAVCGWGRSAHCRQWWIAHLSLGGGGLRAEAAALNNPAALPGAGRAPRSGARFAGRTLHAVRGVDRTCALILTAYRLHVTLRSARHTAPTSKANIQRQSHSTSRGRLALSVQRSPTFTAWRLSARVGWIGRGRSARCRQRCFAHLSLGGGGKGASGNAPLTPCLCRVPGEPLAPGHVSPAGRYTPSVAWIALARSS